MSSHSSPSPDPSESVPTSPKPIELKLKYRVYGSMGLPDPSVPFRLSEKISRLSAEESFRDMFDRGPKYRI